MRHIVGRLLLILSALLAGSLLLECGLRVGGLDRDMLLKTLYYQGGRVILHQVSDDPALLYTLRPGAHMSIHSRSGRDCSIDINQQGARGPELELFRPADTVRILFFGASTVFGVAACDDETLPARLGTALDLLQPARKHQVWNFGTGAYTTSQVIRRAIVELAHIPQVDMVLLLPTNVGRRAFLDGPEDQRAAYPAFFRRDPSLWLENYYLERAAPGLDLARTNQVHGLLLRTSALYRYVTMSRIPPDRDNMAANIYVAQRAAQEALQLEEQARQNGTTVLWVLYPQPNSQEPGFQENHYPFGSRWLNLHRQGLCQEDMDLHPPASSLRGHAEYLAQLLLEGGWTE